jgi:ABC transporter ATM
MMDVLILQLLTPSLQTSALDTYTEQALLQNINSIIKEKARTSVFVAHRLRTIYDSDQILVLQDGHVVESGTHAQLLEMKGVYAELWHGECSLSPFWMMKQ